MTRPRSSRPTGRLERDSLGHLRVPAGALYGIFTQRALETFDLSGRRPHSALVRAYARVKRAAARANASLGLVPRRWSAAIAWAADRIIEGRVPDAAVLDALQAGAGTPMHMNVNEVIANLANERLGTRRGVYRPVHPNNHVNLGQSSNDVTPTAIRLMALELARGLTAELVALETSFRRLAQRERATVKPARTHLQDAVPITWGQVFTGYAEALRGGRGALVQACDELRVLGLGGTAAGTGLTAHPRFARLTVRELSRLTGEPLRLASSTVTTTWSLRPFTETSGALRGIAVDLAKLCVDLRLLSSGPHTGLAEVRLPDVEPGSSIMPGKVNPSVPEAVQMAAFQVIALDHAITLAAAAGELELNVMTPLVALDLADGFELLTRGLRLLRTRCVDGLQVDRARARALVEGSLVVATALSPYLGYEVTAELVKEALASGRPVTEVVASHGLLTGPVLDRVLAPAALTAPRPLDLRLRRHIQDTPAYRQYRAARGLRS